MVRSNKPRSRRRGGLKEEKVWVWMTLFLGEQVHDLTSRANALRVLWFDRFAECGLSKCSYEAYRYAENDSAYAT